MHYAHFAPLGRDLSRLVLGSMVFNPDARQLTFDMLDCWRALGGNVIDTAHLYSGGHSERLIGEWLGERGARNEVVILTKGAHHNVDRKRVTPEDIACDLRDSLARLKTGYVDLYLLHRDDPEVRVGPIVEAMSAHIAAGRIRAWGTSNWSLARIEEANAYAAARGLPGISLSSPHLSLAVPNETIWPRCLDARDPESQAWYSRHQMPLFAWSSQARGFLSGAYSPEVRDNELMVRVYYSDGNWERLRRAEELGRRRGFSTIQVGLAWVLHQPFPVFALIGPATLAELVSSVRALELGLTKEEAQWLDLRD